MRIDLEIVIQRHFHCRCDNQHRRRCCESEGVNDERVRICPKSQTRGSSPFDH